MTWKNQYDGNIFEHIFRHQSFSHAQIHFHHSGYFARFFKPCKFFVSLFLVQDLVYQLQRFLEAMTEFHNECEEELNKANVFPIEVDLCGGTLGTTFDK